jgi:hypothetical protein
MFFVNGRLTPSAGTRGRGGYKVAANLSLILISNTKS